MPLFYRGETQGYFAKCGEWPWSSYGAMMGAVSPPGWLETAGLLTAFARRRAIARERYQAFVFDGMNAESIWTALNAQAFLRDDDFVARSLRHVDAQDDVNILKAQRRAPPPALEMIARTHSARDEAVVACHASGGYS
ncbi:MAG: hypothetical protein PF501_15330 [Salinisphaera sp.]|nr:hypothetical protein [Salinisphaera sp.]